MWRIGVRGAVTASTASLLDELGVAVVETTTLLQTGAVVPDGCARTLAKLQSLGLDVVDLDWVDSGPVRRNRITPCSRFAGNSLET